MSSLITRKEEKGLRHLLSLAPVPEVTLTYQELRGYLFGVAITPDVIEPGEWLPIIFGEQMPRFDNEEQARELTATIFTVLNRHIAAFENGSLFMPFSMENLQENDFETIFQWTSGFEEALSLRPQFWGEYEELGDGEHDHLMNSLLIVEGIVYPEDAIDMFDHIPRADLLNIGIDLAGDGTERLAQIQFFMLQALELSVETIQEHAMRLDEKRKDQVRQSSSPFQLRSGSVAKNADCPCGSKRAFRKCCGVPASQGRSKKSGGDGNGKVIRVDFARKKKDDGPNEDVENGKKGKVVPGYQLEISLASSRPEVWRRVEVPGSITLDALHHLIQLVMGWQDSHLHQFQAGMRRYGPQLADDYMDVPMLDESRFSVADLENDFLQGVVYTYDLGDNWEHVVMLERIIPPEHNIAHPRLVGGERACPPEDIGGIEMYHEFLDYLAGNDVGDLKELFDHPALRGYDPDFFDAAKINELLASLYAGK